jgi:hypothetical protein
MVDVIQPKAEGWRSGLDALLVFVSPHSLFFLLLTHPVPLELGLFSAIVTAFIVPSLAALKQDEMARTNELLLNITNIMILIGGANVTNLNLTHPTVFVPAASDVRLNVYLTLSLIISVLEFILLWKAETNYLVDSYQSEPSLLQAADFSILFPGPSITRQSSD